MAKYTNNDTDVKYFNVHDRTSYDFELIKYDVDQAQDLRQSAQSIKILTNPELISKMFKSPRDCLTAILAISSLIAVILIVICLITYMILSARGGSENEARKEVIGIILLYSLLLACIMIILLWFFNRILAKSIETGYKLKKHKKNSS
jgi:hypothetical protein